MWKAASCSQSPGTGSFIGKYSVRSPPPPEGKVQCLNFLRCSQSVIPGSVNRQEKRKTFLLISE